MDLRDLTTTDRLMIEAMTSPYARALEEASRNAKLLSEIYESTTANAIRMMGGPDWGHLRDVFDSPSAKAARMLAHAAQAMHTWTAASSIPGLPDTHLEALRRLSEPPIASLASALLKATRSPQYRALLEMSAGGGLLMLAGEIDLAETADEGAEALSRLLDRLHGVIATLPPDWLTYKAIVIFLITFVLPFYQWIDDGLDDRADARWKVGHQAHLEAKFDELKESVEQLRPIDGTDRLFVVTAPLRLRTGPSTESETVLVLPPNTMVREVGQEGRWLEVDFFDYLEAAVHRGWVYKRHLKAVEPAEELPAP